MATDGVQNIGNVNLGENTFCLHNFNLEKTGHALQHDLFWFICRLF